MLAYLIDAHTRYAASVSAAAAAAATPPPTPPLPGTVPDGSLVAHPGAPVWFEGSPEQALEVIRGFDMDDGTFDRIDRFIIDLALRGG